MTKAAEVAGVIFSDSDSAPVPKYFNPGQTIFQIWESDSCLESSYNHRSNRNLPTFLLKQWPHRYCRNSTATAEIEKWLRIRVRFFPNFWLRVLSGSDTKTQNPAGVDSCTPDPVPPLQNSRGEHGQDQHWISCRILAIFSEPDWIWIFIFEKNGSGQDQDICLISITKFPGELFKMSQMMVVVFSLLWFLYAQKIKIIFSVCAALITINDNSCYFIIIFPGEWK